MCTYIHGSITHNSQKVQTTQMSINSMDKQNVVCTDDVADRALITWLIMH